MNPLETFHARTIHGRRVRVLARTFAGLIPANAAVLDVGTGDGTIAELLQQLRPDVRLSGVEFAPRDDCRIPVQLIDGRRLPFENNAFNVVMFCDVIHHIPEPDALLADAVRVSRQHLLIKDHLREGMLAGATLKFMDRTGNRRHGVAVPGNYWSDQKWRSVFLKFHLTVDQWIPRLNLYPRVLDWWFGRSLHFVALLNIDRNHGGTTHK